MKIETILNEGSAVLKYRDLDAMQNAVLVRVVTGKADADTASEREFNVMDQLADFGLLDPVTFEPTQAGLQVAQLAKRGAYDARKVARRDQALGRTGASGRNRYSDNGDRSDMVDDAVGHEPEVNYSKLSDITR